MQELPGLDNRVDPDFDSIRNYFNHFRAIFLRPAEFFQQLPLHGKVTGPLAFALINAWVARLIEFMISGALGMNHLFLKQIFDRLQKEVPEIESIGRQHGFELSMLARSWIMESGSVLIYPFLALLKIFFIALIVFLACRLLVSTYYRNNPQIGADPVTFETTLRIVCYGMAPVVLSAVPFLGGFLAWAAILIVTTIGIREVYRVSTGRALACAFSPDLLQMVLILGFALLALVLIVGVFTLAS